jgi:two-component system LytT family response regulator
MSAGRTVVLVEDDPRFGELLREVLVASGVEVQLLTTSAAGLESIEKSQPDVLCLDIDLPDGTGWELLDELERRSIEPERVIITTAGIGATRSRRRPGTFILLKPFPVESLLRLVRGDELPEI